MWLLNARLLLQVKSPAYPSFRGEQINLLWAVPLKQEEYDRIRSLERDTEAALKQVKDPIERLIVFDGESKFL